jgi:hypothetical protein
MVIGMEITPAEPALAIHISKNRMREGQISGSAVGATHLSPARKGWETKNSAKRLPFALFHPRNAI